MANVALSCGAIAAAKGLTAAEVQAATTQTAAALFA